MPPDDPALPWGRNSLKRQTALRIFGIVCFLDWMSATTTDRAYLINPCLVDSEPPMNVNDNSLSHMSSSVTRQPPEVLTDVSYERLMLAAVRMMQRMHENVLCASSKGPGYDVILLLDGQYQDILSHLPSELTNLQTSNQSPLLHWQKHGSQYMIHYLVMKLHRPFVPFFKSTRPQHGYSKDQCIRSASVVVCSVFELRETLSHVPHMYHHAFVATVVLLADMFESIENGVPPSILEEKRRTLLLAEDIFVPDRIPGQNLNHTVTQVATAIKMLLDSVQVKSSEDPGTSSRSNSNSYTSFVEVLKSVRGRLETLLSDCNQGGSKARELQPAAAVTASCHLPPTAHLKDFRDS
ncbi:hypothetical protein BT69DRAFT_1061624 [Atractiella rhizophila]|nr:hypothetical protein BT69DRAFT_1061624 [Atractiella rhizophila]